jgi:hypothetical protein
MSRLVTKISAAVDDIRCKAIRSLTHLYNTQERGPCVEHDREAATSTLHDELASQHEDAAPLTAFVTALAARKRRFVTEPVEWQFPC